MLFSTGCTMMRWINWVLGVGMTLGMVAGCGQRVFLAKEDFDNAHHLIPAHVEEGEPVSTATLTGAVPTPADINSPDRAPRYVTLQEAIALALENGSSPFGGRGAIARGEADDNPVQGVGPLNNQSDKIRVLSMNPAISATNLEASLARFDAVWVTSMNWSATDTLIQGLSSFSNGSSAGFNTGLIKPLSGGGIAALRFTNEYRHLSDPPTGGGFGVFNPFYTSRLEIGFEQPLWRDFGVGINQLLNRHPGVSVGGVPGELSGVDARRGTALTQGPGYAAAATDGILIARLRLDAQRSEFERNLNNMMLNIELAYWKLYQAYGRLYSFEEVMRLAHKAWQTGDARFKAGIIGPANYYPIRGQYEEFRGERTAALGDVLDKERNLRRIIGLPIEDGTRLVPISPPTLAPFMPDWEAARQDALLKRPELSLARDNLRGAQYNLMIAKNFLKPDLRFFANYSPVGFGTRLDGDGILVDGKGVAHPDNAFRSLSNGDFEDWRVGLALTMPLGYRLEHANVRAGRLALAQAYELVKEQEEKATSHLALQYQKLAEWYRLIEVRRAERKAYADSVEARFRQFAAGTTEKGQTPVDFLLEAQRRMATAQVREYEAIAEYNNTLARFEWAKGTILPYNNVHIAEGPLPECAQIRAVDNERDRSRALVLCDRPDTINCPGRHVCGTENEVVTAPVQPMPPAEVRPPAPKILAPEYKPKASAPEVKPMISAPEVKIQPPPKKLPDGPKKAPIFIPPADEAKIKATTPNPKPPVVVQPASVPAPVPGPKSSGAGASNQSPRPLPEFVPNRLPMPPSEGASGRTPVTMPRPAPMPPSGGTPGRTPVTPPQPATELPPFPPPPIRAPGLPPPGLPMMPEGPDALFPAPPPPEAPVPVGTGSVPSSVPRP